VGLRSVFGRRVGEVTGRREVGRFFGHRGKRPVADGKRARDTGNRRLGNAARNCGRRMIRGRSERGGDFKRRRDRNNFRL